MARLVVSVPVLVVLGVDQEGRKHLVALRLAVRESSTSWVDLVLDLQKRGLQGSLLLVSDGHPGLAKALEYWAQAKVQRSTVYKLRNLLKHCPPHAWSELKQDYDQIVYAKDGLRAREAYEASWQSGRGCALILFATINLSIGYWLGQDKEAVTSW